MQHKLFCIFNFKINFAELQVSHVRTLHTSGCLQQEPLALESEPDPPSIFRTRESNPVSKMFLHISAGF